MPTIIPTTAAEHLAKKLVQKEVQVIFSAKNKDGKRHFPDGEIYTRISSLKDITDKVVILHSGMPNPNSGLVELELLLEIVNQSPASSVEVFFAYFPYGMQDKIFQEGETKSAENLIKKLVEYHKVKKIYALDAHFHGQDWVAKYPFINISAVDLLKKAAQTDYPDILFVAPDMGGQRRTNIKGVPKKRIHSYKIEIECDEAFTDMIKNRTIGVVDDILETGGTMVKFYDHCKECGAKNTVALITHGVLPAGIKKIQSRYAKLYLTNTIDRKQANVDVTELIITTVT